MTPPEPWLKGRFTLYETPDGGTHIAYIADGEDETRHIEIPGFIVKNARDFAAGKLNPFTVIKEMMSGA